MDQEELIISTTKRVAKNTGVLITGNIISKLCLLIFFAIVARNIGPEGLGKYAFALSFTALITVLGDMGLNTLAIREVARDRSLISKYLGNIAILKTVLSAIAVGIIFLAITLLNYPPDTTKVVYIIGISAFFQSLYVTSIWCFRAFQRMEYEALLTIAEGALLLGIGFLALYLGKGLIGLAWAYFLTYLIVFILSFLITIKKFTKPKFEINLIFWKYLIRTALPIGLMSIFVMIYLSADTVLLSLIKGDEPVGWYNAGYKLVNFIRFLPAMFLSAIFPVTSGLYKTSIESLKRIIRKSIQYIFLVVLPIGVGTTILSSKIILIFFGEGFRPAILVLQMLIWLVILFPISGLGTDCLIAINKQKISTLIVTIGLIVNIILNLILIPKFSYIGAAIAVIVTGFLITFLALFFLSKNLKFNPFSSQLFKIIIASLLMGFLTWWIKNFNIILVVLVSAIFYFSLLLLTKVISREEKLLLRRIILKTNYTSTEIKSMEIKTIDSVPKELIEAKSLFQRMIKPNKRLYRFLFRLKNNNRYVFAFRNFWKDTDSIFKTVGIETYPICNRRCPFCPVCEDKTPKKIMSDQLFDKILNELKQLHFNGNVELCDYGEPLLDKRLASFARRIKTELGSKILIATNGDLLTKEKFRELVSSGIDIITVSQHDKEPSAVLRNLFSEITIAEKKHLIFQVINENIETLSNRGGSIKVDSMNPMYCALQKITIRADGKVSLCCDDYYNEVGLGDVNKSRLIDIWNDLGYRKLRNERKRGIFNLPICKKCRGEITSTNFH